PLVVDCGAGFHVVAHYLRHAPEDSLTEPARGDALADARAVEKIAVTRHDAANAGEAGLARPHEWPEHAHRRTWHGAAADPNGVAVLDECRRLFERHDFSAEAAVPARERFSQLRLRSAPNLAPA